MSKGFDYENTLCILMEYNDPLSKELRAYEFLRMKLESRDIDGLPFYSKPITSLLNPNKFIITTSDIRSEMEGMKDSLHDKIIERYSNILVCCKWHVSSYWERQRLRTYLVVHYKDQEELSDRNFIESIA